MHRWRKRGKERLCGDSGGNHRVDGLEADVRWEVEEKVGSWRKVL